MRIKIISFLLLVFVITSCNHNIQEDEKKDYSITESPSITQKAVTRQEGAEEKEEQEKTAPENNQERAEATPKDKKIDNKSSVPEPSKKEEEEKELPDQLENTNEVEQQNLKGDQEYSIPKEEKQQKIEKEETSNKDTQADEKPQETEEPIDEEKQPYINISIIGIDNNIILNKASIDYKEGQSVYDILKIAVKNNNIELKTRGSKSFLYITSIAGLEEFAHGPLSGWRYMVNGDEISKSAGAYKVNKNDEIIWKYTTEL